MLLGSGNTKPLLKFTIWQSRWADNSSTEYPELHKRKDEGLGLCMTDNRQLVNEE